MVKVTSMLASMGATKQYFLKLRAEKRDFILGTLQNSLLLAYAVGRRCRPKPARIKNLTTRYWTGRIEINP